MNERMNFRSGIPRFLLPLQLNLQKRFSLLGISNIGGFLIVHVAVIYVVEGLSRRAKVAQDFVIF